jgi:hypothetical protein
MNIRYLALMACAFSMSAAAADNSCTTIKSDKLRLACFDKASKETAKDDAAPAAAPAPPQSAVKQRLTPRAEGEIFSAGSWQVIRKIDPMTDKKNCTAIYQGNWKIQGTAKGMYVSLKGRGGVKAYELRIDDKPSDKMRLANDIEKSISAADLSHSFDRIYNSTRVRLQVLTILGGIVLEDIDTSGFKDAIDFIASGCESDGKNIEST